MKLIGNQEIANRLYIGYGFVDIHMCRPELNKFVVRNANEKKGILEESFEEVKCILMNLYKGRSADYDFISEKEIAVLLKVPYNTVHNYNCRPTLNKFRLAGWGRGVKREHMEAYIKAFKKIYKGRPQKLRIEEGEEHGTVCTTDGLCRT